MKKIINLNTSWQFHLGEVGPPPKTARKAGAIGGLTSVIGNEEGEVVPIGAGGTHFLKLIGQGDVNSGLKKLAGTQLETKLDNSWEEVNLPHDWKIALPYVNEPSLLMSGSKPDGVAYYRKSFKIEDNPGNKRIILCFNGVMRMASIWLNGVFLGENYSGYTDFEFDITETAKYNNEGDNVLLVRVDTTTGAEGWWYEGAGIYRPVYLKIVPEVRLKDDELYFYTKKLGEVAELGFDIPVVNDSEVEVAVTLNIDLNGQHKKMTRILDPWSQTDISDELTMVNFRTWSPEDPYRYEVILQLLIDDQEIYVSKTQIGIKSLAYDEKGFHLNGAPYELRGVCEHQDFVGVGVALNCDIVRFKLLKMKKMGVNAYRSAHHFASQDLLDLCDEIGILVMNENRILEASNWRLADLEKMVRKARNHPSLAFWSISNEEVIGNTKLSNRIAKRIVSGIRKHDSQHLIVSAELLNPEGIVNEDYMANFDVVGVNYPEAAVMGAGLESIKKAYPKQPLMSTENASYFSTRGIYHDNLKMCQTNNFGSMYSMVLPGKRKDGEPGVGGTAHPEEVIAFTNSHPYMGGVFLWTMFDYAGEPAPFNWPGIGSQFGILDSCGFEKDYFYFYQSLWIAAPMVHVMPHWNEAGLELSKERKVEVRVFTNCSEVELFINNQSQGRQKSNQNYNTWFVTYSPGELKAIGYQPDGSMIEDLRITSGIAKKLALKTIFDGDEYQLISIEARDQDNVFDPMNNKKIEVFGEHCQVIGLGNGNPAYHYDKSSEWIHLFSGRALAIVAKEMNKQTNLTAKFI